MKVCGVGTAVVREHEVDGFRVLVFVFLHRFQKIFDKLTTMILKIVLAHFAASHRKQKEFFSTVTLVA